MSNKEFFDKVKLAIESSIKEGAILTENNILTGFSGETMVGVLQRLSRELLDENGCYLEVGVYQGLTLLSVANAIEKGEVYGIDNFAFFDSKGVNFGIVKERIKKLSLSNVNVINMDYEDALESLKNEIGEKKVSVYFIDGPHDYRSQLMCLELIKPYLSEQAVVIIDDSNYRHVRQANRDFLKVNPEFKLFFESYTQNHPLNAKDRDRKKLENTWWNGVNIIVKDVDNELESEFPSTYRSRTLYENEHLIHTIKHPETVPYLVKFSGILAPILYKITKLRNKKEVIIGDYKEMNTYSSNLPENKFNSVLIKK